MTAKERHRIDHFKESMTELSFTLEESAFVMLHTKAESSVFASMMNRLYGWHLCKLNRSDKSHPDFTARDFDGVSNQLCPIYCYHNAMMHNLFVLLCNPSRDIGNTSSKCQYDKILIVQGNNAFAQQQQIYHDLTDLSHFDVDAANYKEVEHEELRYYVRKNLIVSGDYYDFSRCLGASRSMDDIIRSGIVCKLSKSTIKKVEQRKTTYANAGLKEDYQRETQQAEVTRAKGQLTLFGDEASEEAPVCTQEDLLPKSSVTDGLPRGSIDLLRYQLLMKWRHASEKILNMLWEEMCN